MKDVINIREIIFFMFLSLLITGFLFLTSLVNNQTKIVFCDVGQGDASYIRVKNKSDILIDTGPDRKILSCLGKYMPFYDKKIEILIISHWQKDHIAGLKYILERYQVEYIFLPWFFEETKTSNELSILIKKKKIKTIYPRTGSKISIPHANILYLWPDKNTSSYTRLNANDFSSVFLFQEDNYRVLYTGDTSAFVLTKLSRQSEIKTNILKVPHHGSKNGLSTKFFLLADPDTCVISVGRNNSYSHPSKEVLDIIKASKSKLYRTDEVGDVVFYVKN